MSKKPKILITNDDGIHAPGLKALWETLVDFADLTIIAPATEKSGAGVALTLLEPLHVRTVAWEKSTPAWQVTGTPADCVRMALGTILQSPPDFIVSGINRGSNSGKNVLHSGTVGGVIEGALRKIPGIAFSCIDFVNPDYAQVQPFILTLVQYCLNNPLPKGTLLNVNFPHVPTILGVKLARQGQSFWIEDPDERRNPDGHPYYWLGGKWHEQEEGEESDVHLLKAGFATAVPIHVDELTDLIHFQAHKESFDKLFPARGNCIT